MDFSARQLRAFHLIAHKGSFARAAEALYITPSGLSVLIRELENQLGFRIFDRTTRSVSLTAQGRQLLEVTQPALRQIEATAAKIEAKSKSKQQWISVGATPWIAANVIPQAIREFRERRPDLRVRLFDGNLDEVFQQVETGKINFALGIFKSAPGLERDPFFRFSLMVVRPSRASMPKKATTCWSALNGETLISLTPNYTHQQLIDRQLRKSGISWHNGGVVNLLETQVALVEAEEGIAIVPSFGLPAGRTRDVTMSQLVDPVVNLDVYQISNRSKKLSQEADEFSDFLKAYIARWAGHGGVVYR
jgi:DNA-binding transcriptional LysR family regulator